MRVIGVLSGTSVDGVDVAVVDLPSEGESLAGLDIKLIGFETIPWKEQHREAINYLISNGAGKGVDVKKICLENFRIGEGFADAILLALEHLHVPVESVDLVGSHGQTIWHETTQEVEEGRVKTKVLATLQIGEAAIIAQKLGVTTVSDFRVADIAADGNGAPLMSSFDNLFLRSRAGGWRAVQNIGGIGNVTLLPPSNDQSQPLAFDTGPGNVLIDWAVNKMTEGQKLYDENGEIARKGKVSEALLNVMKQNEYFSRPPPKSTGRELFTADLGLEWKNEGDRIARLSSGQDMSFEDFVSTVTELTAWSIAQAYHAFCEKQITEVLISGGGCRNIYLMERIEALLATTRHAGAHVKNHEAIGTNSDAKEAILFALLAYANIKGIPSNVPSCTGAKEAVVLGKITPGKNFGGFQLKGSRC
eukprot:TRINITY_DN3493_c0_g1_i1.p1 TRINITY_DN3493_c0_g1~~TRINITY_DN3493_c0_g1_i1.p1  ORF type:complete len:419 (+),score=77.74 TRINITY_DN3493_c0_g1_i1:33-1289(+)